ncbi:MAG: dihydroorotate dehydrogenase electron transfer subunit [Nitrospirae bacterium]|nr:dihydroorotate dehydrogenase electron transfer subunit [Nitrospirota bacterium]
MSILRWDEDGLEFLIRLKGRGTLLLRNMKPGERIDLLGPLGNGYPEPVDGETPILVAGGVGIASVYPLIERFRPEVRLFYGAVSAGDLYLVDEIRGLTRNLHVSTDDGSMGFRGNAVERLTAYLDGSSVPSPVVYACGPEGMTKSLLGMLRRRGIPGHVSLEERMACGVGACLGCVVETVRGYRRVCKEGPVFDAREIAV